MPLRTTKFHIENHSKLQPRSPAIDAMKREGANLRTYGLPEKGLGCLSPGENFQNPTLCLRRWQLEPAEFPVFYREFM